MDQSLQNAGVLGRVFLGCVYKNAALDGLKPRFLKKRSLKKLVRPCFKRGAIECVYNRVFLSYSRIFGGGAMAAFKTRSHSSTPKFFFFF